MADRAFGEKIGCATLVLTFLGVVAAWLSVPGLRNSERKSPSRDEAKRMAIIPKLNPASDSAKGNSQDSKDTTLFQGNKAAPTSSQPPPPSTTTLNADLLKFLDVTPVNEWPPKRQIKRMNNYTFMSNGCSYIKKYRSLSCFISVTNNNTTKRIGTVTCGGDTTVVNLGQNHKPSNCTFGSDKGIFYAQESLLPGVDYSIFVWFDDMEVVGGSVPHLHLDFQDGEASFKSGVGFDYVRVDVDPY